MVTSRYPGLQGWSIHALQCAATHGSEQDSVLDHSFQHPVQAGDYQISEHSRDFCGMNRQGNCKMNSVISWKQTFWNNTF